METHHVQLPDYTGTPSKIARVTIKPADQARWEVPFDHPPIEPSNDISHTSSVELTQGDNFGFRVSSYVNSDVGSVDIFKTDVGPLVFEEMFMQINTEIPEGYQIYGFGEKDQYDEQGEFGFVSGRGRKRLTIWSAGQPVKSNANLYGHQTLLLGVGPEGHSFGVFLLNSNAMEVEINDRILTYRPIGGVFDFYFFVGDSPTEVIQQYHHLVGKARIEI